VPRVTAISAHPERDLRRMASSSVAPILSSIGVPCVLALLASRVPGTRARSHSRH